MEQVKPTTPLASLREIRLQRIEAMRQKGLNPYPAKSARTHYAGPILADYEGHEGKPVTVAGRMMSWRKQGAMAFGHILDQTGQIQLVQRRGTTKATDSEAGTIGYEDLNLLDLGDIVEATGTVGKTQRGEVSVMVEEFRILAKTLRPLPEKWSGLKDRELVLRKRYLDCLVNQETKARFETIAKMIFEVRQFLNERGFIEITTPMIQAQYGGGTAKPFLVHVNALGCSMYLAISHELYLKRLIAAGYDKVYTIGRYFRNEGIDRSHHPEFQMIETMTAYQNYEYNMALAEDLFRHVAEKAFGKTVFNVKGHEVDFAKPWRRVRMLDVTLEHTGVDFSSISSVDEANAKLIEMGLHARQESVGHALVYAFEEKVQPLLIQPTIVHDHPVEISPLAKPMDKDRRFAERFEIFIAGMECGDNWSEQNDPVQLLERWREAYRPEDRDSGEFHPLDFDFIEMLEHGMPPTTGIGPGIERMAMIFAEQEDIYDVIFFPMMKPHISPVNRQIYGVAGGEGPEE